MCHTNRSIFINVLPQKRINTFIMYSFMTKRGIVYLVEVADRQAAQLQKLELMSN